MELLLLEKAVLEVREAAGLRVLRQLVATVAQTGQPALRAVQLVVVEAVSVQELSGKSMEVTTAPAAAAVVLLRMAYTGITQVLEATLEAEVAAQVATQPHLVGMAQFLVLEVVAVGIFGIKHHIMEVQELKE